MNRKCVDIWKELFGCTAKTLALTLLLAGCGSLKKPDAPDPAVVAELNATRKAGGEAFTRGDLQTANQLAEKALEISEKHLGDNPCEVAKIRTELALVLQASGKFEQSAAEAAKAVPILKDKPEHQREYARALGVQGGALFRIGKTEESIPVMKDAIEGYKKSGDLFTVNGLSMLTAMCMQLYQVGKFEEADKYSGQIRDILALPSARIPVPNRLIALTRLGQAALEQKQWKLALKNYQDALEFGQKNQVEEIELVAIRDNIAKAKKMLESTPK